MQAFTCTRRLPATIHKVLKPALHIHPARTMSFFPRIASSGEFMPLFRLLDDYAAHTHPTRGLPSSSAVTAPSTSSIRAFQPRFDVKESADAFELHGELPGIEQKDVSIEFEDANTIVIKGRTESRREYGSAPALEGQAEQGRIADEGDSEASYHKATVEDEASTTNNDNEQQVSAPASSRKQAETSRYWVSERSTGEFYRSFQFPTRVDQDGVKASLKNGVLSITVPKARAPTTRKIQIE
ncbi:HSP20-like chaperone [Cryomyces antarcticus]